MAFLRTTLIAVLLIAGCAAKREYRVGDKPGCSVASCCGYGWVWNVIGCQLVAPPYCGCYCNGPAPPVYPTQEQCLAEHPVQFHTK